MLFRSGKALGTGIMSEGIGLTDIEVETDKKGAPYLVLSGKAKEKADELGVFSISVSLTHDGGMAAAYCCMLAERKDFNG